MKDGSDQLAEQSPMVQNLESEGNKIYSDRARLNELLRKNRKIVDGNRRLEEQKEDKEPVQEEKDFVDRVWGMGGALAHGAIKGYQSAANSVIEQGNEMKSFLADHQNEVNKMAGIKENVDPNHLELIKIAENPDWVHQPEDTPEKIVSSLAQFFAPFAAVSKASKGWKVATKLGQFGKTTTLGAVTDFAAFDPHQERLSNMLQNMKIAGVDISNPVFRYLAANPKDTAAEGRLKNALEGALLGLTFEAGFQTVKASRALFKHLKATRDSKVATNTMDDMINAVEEANKKNVDLHPPAQSVDEGAGEAAKGIPEGTGSKVEGKVPPKIEGNELPPLPKDVEEVKHTIKARRATQSGHQVPEATHKPASNQQVDEIMNTGKRELDGKKSLTTESMNDSIQIQNTLRKVTGELDKNIGDTVEKTFRTEEDLSTRLLMDQDDDLVEALINPQTGKAYTSTEMAAMNKILMAAEMDSMELLRMIANGADDSSTILRFEESLQRLNLMRANFKGMRTEAARALNIGNLINQRKTFNTMAEQVRYLEYSLQGYGGKEAILKKAKQLIEAGGGIKDIRKASQATFSQRAAAMAKEIWINSLLSGIPTHMRNAVSNTFTLLSAPVERMISGASAKVFGKSGEAQQFYASEGLVMYKALFSGFSDAWRSARANWDTGVSQFKGSKKYEFKRAVSAGPDGLNLSAKVSGKTFKAFGKESPSIGKIVDRAGDILNWPTRALEASDEFTKSLNYRMELMAEANRKGLRIKARRAARKGPAPKGEKSIKEIIDTYIEKPTANMEKNALNAAKERTFTKDVDFLKTRGFDPKSLDNIVNQTPVLKIVAPFTKTNMNLVEYAMNRTPFAKGLAADIKAGGAKRHTAIGRLAFGGMTMATGVGMAASGNISGRGPTDHRARAILRQSGWEPYSILVKNGDKVKAYNFARLEPFGALLGMAADTAELFGSMHKDDDTKAQQFAYQTMAIVAQFYTPEFVTKNMNDFLDAVGGDERAIDNFLSGVVRGAVPFSGTMSTINRQVDPTKRDRRADPDSAWPIFDRMWNEIANITPGLSTSLPPVRDMWGEERTHVNFRDLVDSMEFLTGSDDYDNMDPVAKEIRRFDMVGPAVFGDNPANDYLKIQMPPKIFRFGSGPTADRVRLDPLQYDRYVKLSAGVDLNPNFFGGKTLKETLGEAIAAGYPELPPNSSDLLKAEYIKSVVSTYRKAAKEQLLFEDEELVHKMEKRYNRKISKLSGEEVDINL